MLQDVKEVLLLLKEATFKLMVLCCKLYHNFRQYISDLLSNMQVGNPTDAGLARRARILKGLVFQVDKTLMVLRLYVNVLPLFKDYVMTFQSHQPLVHKLYEKQEELCRNFLGCFVKQELIMNVSIKQIMTLDLHDKVSYNCRW